MPETLAATEANRTKADVLYAYADLKGEAPANFMALSCAAFQGPEGAAIETPSYFPWGALEFEQESFNVRRANEEIVDAIGATFEQNSRAEIFQFGNDDGIWIEGLNEFEVIIRRGPSGKKDQGSFLKASERLRAVTQWQTPNEGYLLIDIVGFSGEEIVESRLYRGPLSRRIPKGKVNSHLAYVQTHLGPTTESFKDAPGLGEIESVQVEDRRLLEGDWPMKFEITKERPSKVDSGPKPTDTEYPVWFGTNREPLFDKGGSLIDYSVRRSSEVSYGRCVVNIPSGHKRGEIEASYLEKLARWATFRKDDQTLEIVNLAKQAAAEHWQDIDRYLGTFGEGNRCGLVFIHGFNVSFQEAAIRTAQLGFDLSINGPAAFFSWPSRGTAFGYEADQDAIEFSQEAIMQYLLDFRQKADVERVHVIAHSMGNRAVVKSIRDILAATNKATALPFANFVLAAPDIDSDLFDKLAKDFYKVANRTTLYVSDRDRALWLSMKIRFSAPRAGYAPPITVVPGVDTVHIYKTDLTLFGHGYITGATELLTDMKQLFNGEGPDDRSALSTMTTGGKKYWYIRP